jgi:triosephosphate isomerase (TIM)
MIIGNWKMHKTSEEAAAYMRAFLPQVKGFKVGLAVPFTALHAVQNDAVLIGAQNMSDEMSGAFTGEISCAMIKDLGAKFVLLGHSERRDVFQESNSFILRKVKRAQEEGILPILCVGEKEGQELERVLQEQLKGISGNLLIAYEPVWAIGTGKTAKPEQIEKAHRFCKGLLGKKTEILYGGSVNSENIAEIASIKEVDGMLVGGASLNPDTFAKIVHQSGRKK